MKHIIFILLAFCLSFESSYGQMSVPLKIKEARWSKNNKMKYDGESSFLFFYQPKNIISESDKPRVKDRLEEFNNTIEEKNKERLTYLEQNFNFPFGIISPNSYKSRLKSDYRYMIFVKVKYGSSGSYMGMPFSNGASIKSYSFYIFDTKTETKKAIGKSLEFLNPGFFNNEKAEDINFPKLIEKIKEEFINTN